MRVIKTVASPCPQCGFAEGICQTHGFGSGRGPSEFRTCPQCGYAEETSDNHRSWWKGYGIYITQARDGGVKAGTFQEPIADDDVPAVVTRFLECGSSVLYVTRWNERTERLEVLLGGSDREP